MGYNRGGDRRKARLKRARKEAERLAKARKGPSTETQAPQPQAVKKSP
jgi:hypothetical protein